MNDENVFQFELNESLYFEKGQEVSEMLKISLDPEITIQPFNEYISIRGVIELQGEYKKVEYESDSEMNTLNFEDYQSHRYLEKIEEIDDGKAKFSHRFPVEISVPSYRVSNTEDITVSIDSFDYEIPTENQLKLKSSIEIQGISEQIEDETDDSNHQELELASERDDDFASETDDTEEFEFEIKNIKYNDQSEEDTTSTDNFELPSLENITDPSTDPDEKESYEESTTPDIKSVDKGRWNFKKSQSFDDFFQKNVSNETSENVEENKVMEDEQLSTPEAEEVIADSQDFSEESEEIETEEDDSKDTVSYLADIFRVNDDEMTKYSQMRLCIVQEKDTIETIAERYQVTELQLLRQNKLEDGDLLEGQLLSIPYKNKSI